MQGVFGTGVEVDVFLDRAEVGLVFVGGVPTVFALLAFCGELCHHELD